MYIRTKDGVYVLSEAYWAGNKDEILEQSENLEELCDCIIETKGHTGDYFHYTYTAFDEPSKKRLLDDMINQDFEIYYAIWTDKGLIYVAKLNENGGLILL